LSADNYRLTCQGMMMSSAGADILLQFGEGTIDNVAWKTSGYQWANTYGGVSGASTGNQGSTSASGIKIADSLKTSNGGAIAIEVSVPALSKAIQHGAIGHYFKASNSGDGYYYVGFGGTYTTDTGAVTALRLQASTGSIASGFCRLRQE